MTQNYDLMMFLDENPSLRSVFDKYSKMMWERHRSLGQGALVQQVPKGYHSTLSSMYTPLNTTTNINLDKKEEFEKQILEKHNLAEDSYLKNRLKTEYEGLHFTSTYSRTFTAVEMLNEYPRLVLLGNSGSGKSTFASYVALSMTGQFLERKDANLRILNQDSLNEKPTIQSPDSWTHGVLLPIFIDLKLFAASKYFPSVKSEGTIYHLLKYIQSIAPNKFVDHLQTYLQMNYVALLIIDGLDEVASESSSCDQIREIITQWTQKYSCCRVLVTSRPYAYQDPKWKLDNEGFTNVRLSEFNELQISNYIHKWYMPHIQYEELDQELWRRRVKDLIASINKRHYLKKLAENPLLLSMIVAVNDRKGGTLPSNRSTLYEESTELLFDNWNRSKGTSFPTLADDLDSWPTTVRDGIQELAFEIHRDFGSLDGVAEISYSRLSKALVSISGNPTASIEKIMEYLHQRSGILIARRPKIFNFPHRSFQEFLAACYLTQHEDYPSLAIKMAETDPQLWREVILFVASRAVTFRPRDGWILAAQLCPHDISSRKLTKYSKEWRLAILAGMVIVENDLVNKKTLTGYRDTLTRIQDWLAACIKQDAMFVNERAEAGRLLSEIGDNRPGVGVMDNGLPNIEWIKIPAGKFLKGSNDEDVLAFEHEKPQRPIFLDTYYISKYPITVAQYLSFIESREYQKNQRKQESQGRWEYDNLKFQNHPIVGVTWDEANRFCRWLGEKIGYEIRLPTEREWEKAARGTDGRIFPWGNDFDNERCNIGVLGQTTAVGIFPKGASPYGCMDMSGNVWEWCSDIWKAEVSDGRRVESVHGIRGGSFGARKNLGRCAYKSKEGPMLAEGQGFRIVADQAE